MISEAGISISKGSIFHNVILKEKLSVKFFYIVVLEKKLSEKFLCVCQRVVLIEQSPLVQNLFST